MSSGHFSLFPPNRIKNAFPFNRQLDFFGLIGKWGKMLPIRRNKLFKKLSCKQYRIILIISVGRCGPFCRTHGGACYPKSTMEKHKCQISGNVILYYNLKISDHSFHIQGGL